MAIAGGLLASWRIEIAILAAILMAFIGIRHETRQHLRRMELRILFAIEPELEDQLLGRYKEVTSDPDQLKLWGNDD